VAVEAGWLAHLSLRKLQKKELETMQVRAAVTVLLLLNLILAVFLVNHRLVWSMRLFSLFQFGWSYLIDVLCCKVFLLIRSRAGDTLQDVGKRKS
jgi:NADH:ubiquinone oxidoreductase subunit 5 (subunit L)/multisubunit Na+/H+ antiporter MnhA subunit